MKVRTSTISGNKADTGMSEVSNVKMWMEFFDSGKILNSTLADAKLTKNSGDWHTEGDSLYFKTDNGLSYSYHVSEQENGNVLLANPGYELTLIKDK